MSALTVDEGRVGTIAEGPRRASQTRRSNAAKAFARQLALAGITVSAAPLPTTAPASPRPRTAPMPRLRQPPRPTAGASAASLLAAAPVAGATIASAVARRCSPTSSAGCSRPATTTWPRPSRTSSRAPTGDDASFEGGVAAVSKAVGDLGLPTTSLSCTTAAA